MIFLWFSKGCQKDLPNYRLRSLTSELASFIYLHGMLSLEKQVLLAILGGSVVKKFACQGRRHERHKFDPLGGEDPLE